MLNLPIFAMGATSLFLQVLCLRQLLSTFSGNELDIGITLSVWLLAVGLGSYAGAKLKSGNAFGMSFIVISVVAQPTLFLAGAIRPLLAFELGEIIPLSMTIAWTVLTVTALCITIGVQFPLAAAYIKGGGGAARVYGLEAVGAFAGGALFTFLLSGTVDTYRIVQVLALLNVAVAFFVTRKKRLLFFLIVPLVFHAVGGMRSSEFTQGMEIIRRAESRYGEITVLKIKDQFNLYSSGKLRFSYPDPRTEELKAHLPMSLHPSARRILIVGGSPAVIREYLKYPVSRIDFVEIDPTVVRVSKGLLSAADREHLEDQRIHIVHADARRYIKKFRSPEYDLVVLNIPEPSTANINRLYTLEFFQEVKTVLKRGGVLFLSVPASFGYIGKKMQTANGAIHASLRRVFPYVGMSSEEYGILAASEKEMEMNPHSLKERFIKRNIDTEYFRPYILDDAFAPMKVDMVGSRLGGIDTVNKDLHPVAYFYNLMLWADMHDGRWLNLFLGLGEYETAVFSAVVLITASAFFFTRGKAVYHAIFTTGYCTMAFSIIVILMYQAFFGYIYEAIGLLTGTFMLGGAAGAYGMRKIPRPEKRLAIIDLAAVVLLLSSPVILKKEAIFYMIIFVSGALGGGQFAAATRTIPEEGEKSRAGKLYAIDLAGSFLGALLTAIVMAPLIGMRETIFFLAFIKLVSLGMLLSGRNKRLGR